MTPVLWIKEVKRFFKSFTKLTLMYNTGNIFLQLISY